MMDQNKDYSVLIVGCGLFGAVIAERIASHFTIKSMIIDSRNHIGGNCYTDCDVETGIEYHAYGTHIFHTSSQQVWEYINRFTGFNSYYHQVLTTFRDKVYQMPINLETINSFYNINLKPFEVHSFLKSEIAKEGITTPRNFEEKAISLIGRSLYEAFIRGYTIKQWQKDPGELPASILNRLPFRTNYNECYFHDRWQGVPEHGYTAIFKKMLDHDNIELHLNTDFFDIRDSLPQNTIIVFSGPIDRFFDYKYGRLEWRTLDFRHEIKEVGDYQGTSVMNYAEEHIPFTRVHEPRHLHPERNYSKDRTLIIKEFSRMDDGTAPYYPINDDRNQNLLEKYKQEAEKLPNVFFGGRLGEYKYLDMDTTIERALNLFENKLRPLLSN